MGAISRKGNMFLPIVGFVCPSYSHFEKSYEQYFVFKEKLRKQLNTQFYEPHLTNCDVWMTMLRHMAWSF